MSYNLLEPLDKEGSHSSSSLKPSPMMMQWQECKKKAEGCLLLFRLGDFYEAFSSDAATLAQELELTLTKRQDIPMAGIPFHTSEGYIDKLVSKGYRVAVAEQVEDPKQAKGLVKREIVRIVTPGTLINSSLLSEKSNNFIACTTKIKQTLGLSFLDLTTAEFKVFEFDTPFALLDELARLSPKELIVSEKVFQEHANDFTLLQEQLSLSILVKEDWHFDVENNLHFLLRHFGVHSLDCFAIQGMQAVIQAAGVLLSHVKETLNLSIDHVQSLRKEIANHYMSLDSTSLRHLEVVESLHEKQSKYTLLSFLDRTKTPMGARLLKFWITHPLLSLEAIEKRQDAIAFFLSFPSFNELSSSLKEVKDLERLIMRIETGFASPKDLLALRLSLEEAPKIHALLKHSPSSLLQSLREKFHDVSEITQRIQKTLSDDPPFRLSDGHVIRSGFHPELDELQSIAGSDHNWIADYQTQLREQTQIKTLKVSYTKAFGYYIEVSRGQADKMPATFQRRQTLLNAERFITPELKEYEYKVLSAEEKISSLEHEIFQELRQAISSYGKLIRDISSSIAQIDCLFSLAQTALSSSFVRPVVDHSHFLHIEGGRHPVIEASLRDHSFIPNDTFLNATDHRLLILTGPNMAGKSTFMRQVALMAILAQVGSFVPATKARIGILDKIFTRIGASDNLARGQSTFMVEMAETASILHNATERSLVLLDEIGRGTSTYDGISIAWAVAEYLLTTSGKQAKTLFATHYYELTELEGKIPGAVNYCVSVHESSQGITFLHKIIRGKADKSYGIHVAKLAGLPTSLLRKAHEVLKSLEKTPPPKSSSKKEEQLTLFSTLSPTEEHIINQMRRLDLNHLTPLEALKQLFDWKQKIL